MWVRIISNYGEALLSVSEWQMVKANGLETLCNVIHDVYCVILVTCTTPDNHTNLSHYDIIQFTIECFLDNHSEIV